MTDVIGKPRIKSGIVQARDFFAVDADALQAHSLRQVNPKATALIAGDVHPQLASPRQFYGDKNVLSVAIRGRPLDFGKT